MKKDLIVKLHKSFEDYMYTDENNIEFWYARELQGLLEYTEWRNFEKVIQKAQDACKNSGHGILDHFVEVNKMVEIGSGAVKEIKDYKLTRYACYLIAQNGDPKKSVIAFAQTYFAVQTRKQEVIEQRLLEIERIEARHKLTESDKNLSKAIFEKGIDHDGFGRIKSKGDKALFGKSTQDLKKDFGISDKKPLADVLPTITLRAKDFANAITAFNTNQNNLDNEDKITNEHVKNNQDVRKVLTDRNIYPEKLPPEEDIKKVERRVKKDTKLIAAKKTKQIKNNKSGENT